MALSTSVSEAYAAIARNLRFSDVIVLIITTSFVSPNFGHKSLSDSTPRVPDHLPYFQTV
jgi:hypothetical protein